MTVRGGCKIWSVAVLLLVGILLVSSAYGIGEKLTLKVSCSGKHTVSGGIGSTNGYPFDLSGEAKVSYATLLEGGENALQAVFGSLTDKKNANAKVTSVSGDLRIKDGKVSGNVRIEWTIQGNVMFICGDIEGSAESDGVNVFSISFKGTNVEAGGSWNWGGGVVKMGGSGSFSVSSQNIKDVEQQVEQGSITEEKAKAIAIKSVPDVAFAIAKKSDDGKKWSVEVAEDESSYAMIGSKATVTIDAESGKVLKIEHHKFRE